MQAWINGKEITPKIKTLSKKGTVKMKDIKKAVKAPDKEKFITEIDEILENERFDKKKTLFPPIDTSAKFPKVPIIPLRVSNSLALWDIWEDYEETTYDRIYRFFRYRLFRDYLNPEVWYDEIKYFIQRGRRGYSDRDLWSYDWYLAKVIRDGLSDLAKNTHGHPVSFKTQKSWEKKLNEIANTFDFHINGEDEIITNKFTELRKDKKLTREQKDKEYVKTCKKFEKLSKKNREKMQDFVKYFGNFWD